MLSGKEELAGGFRLANIRKTKRYLYLVELLILIVAVIVVIYGMGMVTLAPFYLPLNSFLYFVLLMTLIIVVEGFVFKALEMRLISSSSTKYYITKVSIRRGIVAIAISVVVVALLWTPFISDALQDALTTSGSISNTHSTTANAQVSFFDRDALGLSMVNEISVRSIGGSARVYVVSEQTYDRLESNVSQMIPYRINIDDYVVSPQLNIPLDNLPHGKYYLVLDTVRSEATSINFEIKSTISPTFLDYVPLFAIFFVVAYGAWIAYLIPLNRKYSSKAIYK